MTGEGYLLAVQYMLNGAEVTEAELRAGAEPDPCTCAPGLGYVCSGCSRGE